jgi:hypothetical protein
MHTFTSLEMFGMLMFAVPFIGVILWALLRGLKDIRKSFISRGFVKTAALVAGFWVIVILGADKGPAIKPQAALKMCLARLGKFYPGSAPIADKAGADLADTRARNADQDVSVGIDAGHLADELADATMALAPDAKRCLIDIDWFHDTRAPFSLNPLASQVYVESFVSNSVLMDMHYVAFSEEPSSAPQMYFQYYDADSEQVINADCIGFPGTVPVVTWANGQARTNICYRMLNAVPTQYVQRSRTWDGEVLFGGPVGSAIQFEASGVFIISDANNSAWQGRTWSGEINGESVEFINGILVAKPGLMSAAVPAEEERGLFSRVAGLFRAAPAPAAKKLTHAKGEITVTQGKKSTGYALAFKNNRKEKK